jgi:predicted SprT family Zn-dependent metalloprotease
MMTRQDILDKLEEIHDKCAKQFLGSNEADLHFKEDVADWILSLTKESDSVTDVSKYICDCGNSDMTWYGNNNHRQWFCFNCKKELDQNKIKT